MLFSENLKENKAVLPDTINQAIFEIGQYTSEGGFRVFKYDVNHIAVGIMLAIELPSLGTIGGIDIRSLEPVLIKINIRNYPQVAPVVLSDRTDFPKKNLSHLYASKCSHPSILCLTRGNLHEWFAGKRIVDLLDVAKEWFHKAGKGKLDDDGNEFDPIRLDGFNGYHIYQYEMLKSVVEQQVEFMKGFQFSCLFSIGAIKENKGFSELIYKSYLPVQFIKKNEAIQLIKNGSGLDHKAVFNSKLLSIVVWSPDNIIDATYATEMPNNYAELKDYFTHYDIEIKQIVQFLASNNLIVEKALPIIHAIKRPKKVIGVNGDFEFINFVIVNIIKGKFENSTKVIYQSHIEPFSSSMAQKLTNDDRGSKTLFVGAGSLGSKIIMHDARSGKLNIGVCDDDNFLEHNLARHVLFADQIGENKANSIVDIVSKMFKTDLKQKFTAFPDRVSLLSDTQLFGYDWIVDTTASLNVQNWLSEKNLMMNIARCELAHEGKLGLLYIEGKDRNPRIDDLVNYAYFKAMVDIPIAEWRKADSEVEPTTLEIGLGCSSTTTIMADDAISSHAAVFSRLLHTVKDRSLIGDKGLLFRNMISLEGFPSSGTAHDMIDPFEIYKCNSGSKWEVRLMNGITQRLLALCDKFKPRETGGVMIGVCNYKTRTIHVFDVIEETIDSKGSCKGFTRGIFGLPEGVDVIKRKTGGVIGYVGEWHTHPMDMETLSARDHETIEELKEINNRTPIPTCAVIVTTGKVIPFIYE